MGLPPCDKRKTDRSTGVDMCYAKGRCIFGDMFCKCRTCLKSHGGKCPEGRDRRKPSPPKMRKKRVPLRGRCADCIHAERGSYFPMYVGERRNLWGTVRCIRNKRSKRVHALTPTDCQHFRRRRRVP